MNDKNKDVLHGIYFVSIWFFIVLFLFLHLLPLSLWYLTRQEWYCFPPATFHKRSLYGHFEQIIIIINLAFETQFPEYLGGYKRFLNDARLSLSELIKVLSRPSLRATRAKRRVTYKG